MSVEMNESYYRCLDELRTRYKDRGLAGNMRQTASLKEGEAVEKTPESYVLFDSKSNIADCYRSGVYNGSKYMTSDDFVRYFKSRRAFYMPEALRKKQEETEIANTAVPQRKVGARGSGERGSESGSKEGHLKTLISALVELKDKSRKKDSEDLVK